MKVLFYGLGNDPSPYHRTRHNAGRLFVEYWAQSLGLSFDRQRGDFCYAVGNIRLGEREVEAYFGFAKGYINHSGISIRSFFQKEGWSVEELVVAHDDVETPFGEFRILLNGGHRGHNGLRNLIEILGSRDFYRIRIGVGKNVPNHQTLADYVLSPFLPDQWDELPSIFEAIRTTIEQEGLQAKV